MYVCIHLCTVLTFAAITLFILVNTAELTCNPALTIPVYRRGVNRLVILASYSTPPKNPPLSVRPVCSSMFWVGVVVFVVAPEVLLPFIHVHKCCKLHRSLNVLAHTGLHKPVLRCPTEAPRTEERSTGKNQCWQQLSSVRNRVVAGASEWGEGGGSESLRERERETCAQRPSLSLYCR